MNLNKDNHYKVIPPKYRHTVLDMLVHKSKDQDNPISLRNEEKVVDLRVRTVRTEILDYISSNKVYICTTVSPSGGAEIAIIQLHRAANKYTGKILLEKLSWVCDGIGLAKEIRSIDTKGLETLHGN
jgi:hypothetical protein